jgi:hypothetical protein
MTWQPIRASEERDRSTTALAPRLDVFTTALTEFESRVARAGAPRGPRPIDSETEERLAALGYVAGSVNLKKSDEAARGDPKDKIALCNLMKEASTLSFEGKVDEAIATIKQALDKDPEIEGLPFARQLLQEAEAPG